MRSLAAAAVLLGLATACQSSHPTAVQQTQPSATASPTASPLSPSLLPTVLPTASLTPAPRTTTRPAVSHGAAATPASTPSPTSSPRPVAVTSPSPKPAPRPSPTRSPAPKPTIPKGTTHTIHMQSPYAFSPMTLTIAVGDSIRVVNDDSTHHTFTDSGVFDSGDMGGGASYTYRFTRAGTFDFVCTYHESLGMKGRVTVR
ncbi:MAG: blue (type 1) copper domain protein [Frankiales bacterium]|nr:blue (type 1) copper domain protein [Frankiales bacterium]